MDDQLNKLIGSIEDLEGVLEKELVCNLNQISLGLADVLLTNSRLENIKKLVQYTEDYDG